MIDRYTRPSLAAIWSDSRRYDVWLQVELAACEAMEGAGSVPRGTAAAVRERAAGKLNPPRILEIENRTRHDVTDSIRFQSDRYELDDTRDRHLHRHRTGGVLGFNRRPIQRSVLSRGNPMTTPRKAGVALDVAPAGVAV